MPTKLKLLATLLAFGVAHAVAQTAAPAKTTVHTKTSEQDGRTTTERTFTTTVTEVAEKPKGVTVAIFTANRAGKVGDEDLGALEDYVTGKVTELNVHVISGETALKASSGMAPGAAANALDAQLADSTSAVRLAQNLGATHLLQVTLSGFDSNKKTIDAYGVKTINDERTARVTYKILDGNTGASLAADTVRVSKVYQHSETMTEDRTSVVNELLAEASEKIAASLKRQLDRGRLTASAAQGDVSVTISTELADLYIPDVRIDKDNTVRLSEDKLKVSAIATVEVDGFAVGTAPGKLTVKAGLHKVRVVRDGFKPWERSVNFVNGQTLNVGLEMSEAGYARWKETTAFINDLKNGAKLTDGQVKVLEGQAKMLEQSGIKVNTKEGLTINTGPRSLFGW